jgi:cytochrome c peroxidase
MHDGRFKTLEEVLDHYDSGIRNSSTLSAVIVEADNQGAAASGRISLHLTPAEKAAIIAFLNTLTDGDFVAAERFSDPFAPK